MQTLGPDAITPAGLPLATSQQIDSARERPSELRRVLHVINGEHFAGAERVQQHLGRKLGQFGFDPLFALVKPGQFEACAQLRSYQIHKTPMDSRLDRSVVPRVVELAVQEKAELLHAHTPRTAMIVQEAAKRLNLPWVYHIHSPTARDSTRGILNRANSIIERLALGRCDMVLTVSRSLRREMLRQGVSRKKLMVVQNGVPAIAPIDADARLYHKTWRIGLLALMRPRKGVEEALRAMQRACIDRLPVRLDLIGAFETPQYQHKILGMIESLGLDEHVCWKGFTNDVANAISRLDALLVPSLFGEGMPMVVLESISAGVPVIATNVEGIPEVIRDGQEGLLCDPADSDALYECIRRLTDSRNAWRELSESALKRHRSSFSDNSMAKRVADAYTRVLENCERF